MMHLILFYYIFTFAFGLGSLFTYILITFKTKNRLLLHILVFYFAFTLTIFHIMFFNYLKENLKYLEDKYFYLHYILDIISRTFLTFSIPFFTAYIANFKWRKLQNIIFAVFSVLLLIFKLFFNLDDKYYILSIVLILSIAYAITIGLINYNKINDREQKRLLRNVCIVAIIFFPGIIYNEFPVFNFNINVAPLLYCSFCTVFILFVVKIYIRDYYISEQEIESLKDSYKVHKKSNVFDKFNLSDREREVTILLLKGYSNKKIADVLFISVSTVKTHIHNVFQKTSMDNRYELIHLIKFS